jgi:hypothetical protein
MTCAAELSDGLCEPDNRHMGLLVDSSIETNVVKVWIIYESPPICFDWMPALNMLVMLLQSEPCQCHTKAIIKQKATQYAYRTRDS